MEKAQKKYIKYRIKLVFAEYRDYIYHKRGKAYDAEYWAFYEKEKALLTERFNDHNYIEGDDFETAFKSRAIYDAMGFAFNSIDKMKYASYILKTRGGDVRKWFVAEMGSLQADMEFLKDRLLEMKNNK
jgi:hypothetical protein